MVLDAALGASSLSWVHVQPQVSKFTRVCSYDRAGFGWSDPGPLPRTAGRIVQELRALLHNAAIPRPYVLVGHSYGGLTARLYAAKYPEEVCGIVLVDAAHPQEWANVSLDQRKRIQTGAMLSRRGAQLARVGIARFISILVRAGALNAARSGVTLASRGALRGQEEGILAPVHKLPPEIRPLLQKNWTQPKFFEALASQIETISESAAEVAAAGSTLSDIPLVVLSIAQCSATRIGEHKAALRLSTDSTHCIVKDSGHWIPVDQPDVVVKAIRDVVDAVRLRRRLRG